LAFEEKKRKTFSHFIESKQISCCEKLIMKQESDVKEISFTYDVIGNFK